MGRQTGFWLTAMLLLMVLTSASAEDNLTYVVVGGSLKMNPPVGSGFISIVWKYNSNLITEWDAGMVDVENVSLFKGRAALNLTTGCLEIKNLIKADTGSYSVEINKDQSLRYDIKVIKKVLKPVILVCSSAPDSCNLTCEGNTTDAGPVTYSWMMGDGDWKESEQNITLNTEEMRGAETVACRMKNPVSEEVSEPHVNPFLQQTRLKSRHWVEVLRTVLTVLGVVSLLWAAVYLVWRNREAVCRCVRGADDGPS